MSKAERFTTRRTLIPLGVFALLCLSSCETIEPGSNAERRTFGTVTESLKRFVKIEGRVDTEGKKLCAAVTILGVGPEVCLGFKAPAFFNGCDEDTPHEIDLATDGELSK